MTTSFGEEARVAELVAKGGEEIAAHVTEDAMAHGAEDVAEHAGEDVASHACGGLSFSYNTTVATSKGAQAIGSLKVRQKVWAYNPTTKKMELEPIKHVWINHDDDLVDLAISYIAKDKQGHPVQQVDTIHTNKKHPFLTQEQGFTPVAQLMPGMHILRADGSLGTVVAWEVVPGTSIMYNLEVDQDHTYTVSNGQWVVHNCGSTQEVVQNLKDSGVKISDTGHFEDTFGKRASNLNADNVKEILSEGEHYSDAKRGNFVAVKKNVAGKGIFRVAYDGEGRLLSIAGKANGAGDIIGNFRRYTPAFLVVPGWTNPFAGL